MAGVHGRWLASKKSWPVIRDRVLGDIGYPNRVPRGRPKVRTHLCRGALAGVFGCSATEFDVYVVILVSRLLAVYALPRAHIRVMRIHDESHVLDESAFANRGIGTELEEVLEN